jgi:Holliday junction resolvasome RuvABC endonuclease subunit
MRVVGVDPGTVHLGLCVIETGPTPAEDDIALWTSHAFARTGTTLTCAAIIADLDDIFSKTARVDRAVIERQPLKNPAMKRMESLLEMYFASRGVDVTVLDARRKLIFAASSPHWTAQATDSYGKRKRASIDVVAKFLEGSAHIDDSFKQAFFSAKKRDDLADSLLTARAFVHAPPPPTKAVLAASSKAE